MRLSWLAATLMVTDGNPLPSDVGRRRNSGIRGYLSVSPKENLPNKNGREVGGVDDIGLDGYGSCVVVGNPQIFPLRISIATFPYTCWLPSGARNMKVPGSKYKGWTSPVCALTAGGTRSGRTAITASKIAITVSKSFITPSTFIDVSYSSATIFLKTSTDTSKSPRPARAAPSTRHAASVYTFEPAIFARSSVSGACA